MLKIGEEITILDGNAKKKYILSWEIPILDGKVHWTLYQYHHADM